MLVVALTGLRNPKLSCCVHTVTMASQGSDTDAAIQASGESTLERAAKKAQEKIQNLFHVSLSVAVTGETGTGKSSFINAVRGLDDDEEAETGVTETTMDPTPYKHPTIPTVEFWDLPGTGSPNFKAKTYSKKMKFDKYDFFFIVSSTRFKENDFTLAKEIQKRKKHFYFIRSKIDQDVDAEKKKKKENFNEEETLVKIRRNCEENLKECGNPKVFLISSMDLSKFDFEELVATLLKELPQHKQYALLQSVPVSSLAMLERKVKMFEKAVWAAAIVSGGIAAAPVPGLSFACDTAIVGGFFTRCYYAFGLDDKSLEKLAERVNKPHLKSLNKSPLLKELAQKSALRMGGSALGEFLCSLIPGVGSAAAASISFTMTRDLLQKGLEVLAEEARKVLREAGLK